MQAVLMACFSHYYFSNDLCREQSKTGFTKQLLKKLKNTTTRKPDSYSDSCSYNTLAANLVYNNPQIL